MTSKLEYIRVHQPDRKGPTYVNPNLIFSFYYAEGMKCTHIVATGGGMVPVKESPEELKQILTKTGEKQNDTNN